MPKAQTPTPKLNDTQLVMTAAAQRDDHALLPLPENLTAKGAALERTIESLRKRNIIEERRIVDGAHMAPRRRQPPVRPLHHHGRASSPWRRRGRHEPAL